MKRSLWLGLASSLSSVILGFATVNGLTVHGDTVLLSAIALDMRDPQWLVGAVRIVTFSGSPDVRAVAIAGIATWLLLRRTGRIALAYLFTVGLSIAGYGVMKMAFERPRPMISPWFDTPTNAAYPSGHAAGAAVVLVLGALLAASDRKWVAVAAGLTAAIGISRLLLGVHWPSDVIGGWLWGGGCALIGFALIQRENPLRQPL